MTKGFKGISADKKTYLSQDNQMSIDPLENASLSPIAIGIRQKVYHGQV